MRAVQAALLPPFEPELSESQARPCFRVQIDHWDDHRQFIDYLHRLGCSVASRGGGVFDVSVTDPDTVDDEARAIAKWCASWSRVHRPAQAVVTSVVAATN